MNQDTQETWDRMAEAFRAEAEKEPLYFNTVTLSRFMSACHGAGAAAEAQRRVAAYTAKKEPEIAEIWKRVVAHLTGVEIKEDQRRILKVNRPLSFKP